MPMLRVLLEAGGIPWHWQVAPMPQAELWLLRDGALLDLPAERTVAAAPAVLDAMLAAADEVPALLAARDEAGQVWRLRRCGGRAVPLWSAQPVEHSRTLLFEDLRSALARVLARRVQHELCSPLQTLAFNADIASRLTGQGTPGRALANLEVIRRNVQELQARQSAAVDLWFAGPPDYAVPASLRGLFEAAADLLRGHLVLQGVRLESEELAALDGAGSIHEARQVQIALLALLLMAGTGAAATRSATEGPLTTLKLRVVQRDNWTSVELDTRVACSGLGAAFEAPGCAAALATVALLLEPAGMVLDSDDASVRLLLLPERSGRIAPAA